MAHLTRVLRLRDGEVVCVADGRGGYRLCEVTRGDLVPLGERVAQARITPELTVAFAAVKGERPAWAVQKLTELGMDHIVLLQTERSVVRWDHQRAQQHLRKLGRVARGAAAQCRRLWLPSLRVSDLAAMKSAPLADAGGRPLGADDHCLLIGPEGGWTDGEREGRDLVALAENVLRTETAALAAGVAMSSLRIGLTRAGLSSFSP